MYAKMHTTVSFIRFKLLLETVLLRGARRSSGVCLKPQNWKNMRRNTLIWSQNAGNAIPRTAVVKLSSGRMLSDPLKETTFVSPYLNPLL